MNRLKAAVRKELTAGPMATRGFPLLLAGQFTSSIGDLCYAVAMPWLILSHGGSPVLLGTVLACYGVARTVGIPIGGILADRFGPRQIMLTTDIVRFAVVGLLGVIALDNQPHVVLLVPIAVLVGACEGFFLPASFALLPSLLPEKELAAGNSLSSIATQGGSLLGPVVGGLLVATVGPGPALLVDALTFAVSAATLYAMRPVADGATGDDEDVEAEPAVIPATFGEVLRRGRLLHIILAIGLIGNLVYAGAAEVALPTLAHRDFGAAGYGFLLLGLGGGMIAGAVLARRDWVGDQPAPFIAVLGLVMALAIGTVPFAGGLAGAVVCMTLFAVANSWSGIVIMTMLQVWTPRHVLARVMSVLMLAVTGTFPISVAISGFGVDRYGVTAFFPVAGAAIALGILGALSRPAFRRYKTGDRFPQLPAPTQNPATPNTAAPNTAAQTEGT